MGKESAFGAGDSGDSGSTLGQDDPLEEEVATHSSILAWGIPWIEEPGGLQSIVSQRVRHDLVTKQQQHRVGKGRKGWILPRTNLIVLSPTFSDSLHFSNRGLS